MPSFIINNKPPCHYLWAGRPDEKVLLQQVLLPDMLLSHNIALTLSKKIPGIKNGSFSELDLLEEHLWSRLLLEAMLMSTIFAVHRVYLDIHGPCYCQ